MVLLAKRVSAELPPPTRISTSSVLANALTRERRAWILSAVSISQFVVRNSLLQAPSRGSAGFSSGNFCNQCSQHATQMISLFDKQIEVLSVYIAEIARQND